MASRNSLLILGLLGLILLAVVLFWTAPAVERPAPEIPVYKPVAELPVKPGEAAAPEIEPLRLDLRVQLVEAAASSGKGFEPSKAGKNAWLQGSVSDVSGAPLAGAKLRFVAGLNQGLETQSEESGRFSFPAIFPGLHQLEISGPLGKMIREVRLNPETQETREFQFGALSSVLGRVVDRKGAAIEGAEVEIDGQKSWSDREGNFFLNGILPGESVIYAKADGYSYFRQNLSVPPNYRFEPGKLQIVLAPGGTLSGGVYPVGGAEPALLYLVPNLTSNDRSFPFEKFYGIEVPAGGSFSLQNVPLEKSMNLFAFHARSAAQPPMSPVLLRGKTENIIRLDFRFSSLRPLQGKVRSGVDGRAVSGARVRLLGHNPYASISQVLKIIGPGMGSLLVPMLPCSRKEVTTDHEGKFYLEAGDGAVRSELVTLLIEAPGYLPYEKSFSGPRLEEEQVVLYPPPSQGRKGSLELHFRPSLPVEVSLTFNGVPKDVKKLSPGESFVLPELAVGVYRVDLRSGGIFLLREDRLPIAGSRSLEVPLPR